MGKISLPRLVIAGTSSGVGKTTVATGLMAALVQRGLVVQGFKVGPDFIDPGFHSMVTGRISRNLDSFLLPQNTLLELFIRSSRGADLAVVEGVMGLFDGVGKQGLGSTSEVARLVKAPVVLVLDASSQAQSAAAVVLGFCHLQPDLHIGGVILNNVSSNSHLETLCQAITGATKVSVLGWLPKSPELHQPSRHLGLVPAAERPDFAAAGKRLAAVIEAQLDLGALYALANRAEDLDEPRHSILATLPARDKGGEPVPVAVARDRAFNFYYQDGLDTLRLLGAELLEFSPLEDPTLPEGSKGLILGGGFPEMFLEELSRNTPLLNSLRKEAAAGLPIYAECGGLLYLCRRVVHFTGQAYPMAGLVPGEAIMGQRLAGMGYRRGVTVAESIIGAPETEVTGHEFHYSSLRINTRSVSPAYRLYRLTGEQNYLEGYNGGNILASYLHLHLTACPDVARYFLNRCLAFHSNKLVGND